MMIIELCTELQEKNKYQGEEWRVQRPWSGQCGAWICRSCKEAGVFRVQSRASKRRVRRWGQGEGRDQTVENSEDQGVEFGFHSKRSQSHDLILILRVGKVGKVVLFWARENVPIFFLMFLIWLLFFRLTSFSAYFGAFWIECQGSVSVTWPEGNGSFSVFCFPLSTGGKRWQ